MTSIAVRDLDIVPLICETIARRSRIQVEDVKALAKFCNRGVNLTVNEAEAVFALARNNFPACPEWSDLFAESMGGWFAEDYTHKTVDAEKAGQLIEWLGGPDARLGAPQFRLLTSVLEQLPACPEELLSFARACLVRAMGVDAVRVEKIVKVA